MIFLILVLVLIQMIINMRKAHNLTYNKTKSLDIFLCILIIFLCIICSIISLSKILIGLVVIIAAEQGFILSNSIRRGQCL